METFENLPEENPWVEIRQSKYGRGLFAKKDIPIGTKVCYYDVIEVEPDDYKFYNDKALNHFTDSKKMWIGLDTPKNNWGVGQIANDYISPIVKEFPDIHAYDKERVKKIVDSYAIISKLNSTLDFAEKPSRWMITLRVIKKDEELTYSYGNIYWYKYLIEDASKPLWRLIYFSLARKNKSLQDQDYDMLCSFLNFTDDNLNTNIYNIPEAFRKSNKDRIDYLWKFLEL